MGQQGQFPMGALRRASGGLRSSPLISRPLQSSIWQKVLVNVVTIPGGQKQSVGKVRKWGLLHTCPSHGTCPVHSIEPHPKRSYLCLKPKYKFICILLCFGCDIFPPKLLLVNTGMFRGGIIALWELTPDQWINPFYGLVIWMDHWVVTVGRGCDWMMWVTGRRYPWGLYPVLTPCLLFWLSGWHELSSTPPPFPPTMMSASPWTQSNGPWTELLKP